MRSKDRATQVCIEEVDTNADEWEDIEDDFEFDEDLLASSETDDSDND